MPWDAIASVAGPVVDRILGPSAMQKSMVRKQSRQQKLDNRWRDREFRYAKRTQREQWQREDNALQRRVADARAAGISPLAAIGASGAGSTLGTPIAGRGGSAPSGSYGAGSNIGEGVSSAIRALNPERREQIRLDMENQRLNNDLVQAQIDNINADTLVATSRSLPGAAAIAESGAIETGRATVTNPYQMTEDGRLVDAETWQARYGEPGEWLSVVPVLISDAIAGYREFIKDRYPRTEPKPQTNRWPGPPRGF